MENEFTLEIECPEKLTEENEAARKALDTLTGKDGIRETVRSAVISSSSSEPAPW